MFRKLSPQSWQIQVVSLLPGVCRNLKSIVVQVGIVDYFKEPHSPEAKKMFEEMVNKLQVKDTGSRIFMCLQLPSCGTRGQILIHC